MTKTDDIGWKPVRDGDTYCSPLCGHGCTYIDYQSAAKVAGALSKLMDKGWKPHVWENLGWHWEIARGGCTIQEDGNGNYWIDLFEPEFGQINRTVSDPVSGYAKLVADLEKWIKTLA